MGEQFIQEIEAVSEYDNRMALAKNALIQRELHQAKEILTKALAENFLEPAAYNLMGVVFEYEGEKTLAKKMYRAALAVEPSYKPAIENLDRICQWVYSNEGINWG